MLDISIMYSLMFSLFVYFMPTSFLKRVLVSAFSFLAKTCSISRRNFVALTLSLIEPRNASGIERFISIRLKRLDRSHFSILASLRFSGVEVGRSTLNARSNSIQPRTISTFSFQILKLLPLSMGIPLT